MMPRKKDEDKAYTGNGVYVTKSSAFRFRRSGPGLNYGRASRLLP
jgi:hypothetical protein